jgi:hypothetical protein
MTSSNKLLRLFITPLRRSAFARDLIRHIIKPFRPILLQRLFDPANLELSIRKRINEHQESLLFADPFSAYL